MPADDAIEFPPFRIDLINQSYGGAVTFCHYAGMRRICRALSRRWPVVDIDLSRR